MVGDVVSGEHAAVNIAERVSAAMVMMAVATMG